MSKTKAKQWIYAFVTLVAVFFLSSFLVFCLPVFSQATGFKAVRIEIKDRAGKKVGFYEESHALLVGVSNYTAGWSKLASVLHEIHQMEVALKQNGFNVVKVLDPTSDQLWAAFENFIDRYGFEENNRLFFFFSGHGHTRKQGKKGYLVPADAPDPNVDDKGFARKALELGQVLTWARRIEARHALFVFDSCFSGTIFKTKAIPRHPPHISDMIARPVRQFISSGSAGEEVPAKSVFVPSFIRALTGEGDLNGDSYVTGTELGMYLHSKVLSYQTGQTPQYGKIKDPDFDEGDFVFFLTKLDSSLDIPRETDDGTNVPLPSDTPGSTLDIEDKAFALYKSAQGNKRQGRFQGAEENLKKSLALLSKNSSYYDDINEELHYHLPLAKARWHIEHHQIKELEATIQSLEGYIENHSKRFAYMKTIDELYTSLHYLERALEHNVRARLRNIEIILQNEFAENGEYPKSQEDFARLVARFLSNDLALRSYKTNRDGYEAVFWDNKREVLVKIPSGQN